jgi:hypothetical protein
MTTTKKKTVRKADIKEIVRENYGAIARERPMVTQQAQSSC